MLPQIGKLINNHYMVMRRQQTENILGKRTSGVNAIWDSAAAYVETVNNDQTKAENKFVINVRVKVNPFSEDVWLVFENVDQTSSVS